MALEPHSIKGLFRRGKAHGLLGSNDAAIRDFQLARKHAAAAVSKKSGETNPKISPLLSAISHELRSVQRVEARQTRRAQRQFRGIFQKADLYEDKPTPPDGGGAGAFGFGVVGGWLGSVGRWLKGVFDCSRERRKRKQA